MSKQQIKFRIKDLGLRIFPFVIRHSFIRHLIAPRKICSRQFAVGKKYFTIFFIFLFCGALTSCSKKIYFTKETREFAEENDISLTKLQFYVDRKVEIKRELSSSEVSATGGKIVLEDGKQIFIVTLNKRTGGVCIKIKNNRTLDIAFETSDSRFFTFNTPADGIIEYEDAKYNLVIGDFNSDKDASAIQYDGQTYYIDRASAQAKLKVKKKNFKKLKVKKRKMKGRKVK